MRVLVIAVGAALVIAVGGCGSTSPLCSTPCATVTGVVERCGGIARGGCTLEHVASVSLLDSKGRPATTAFPAQGHTLSRFSLTAQVPGRYELETTVARQRITRRVNLRAGRTVRSKLVLQVK